MNVKWFYFVRVSFKILCVLPCLHSGRGQKAIPVKRGSHSHPEVPLVWRPWEKSAPSSVPVTLPLHAHPRCPAMCFLASPSRTWIRAIWPASSSPRLGILPEGTGRVLLGGLWGGSAVSSACLPLLRRLRQLLWALVSGSLLGR